MAVSNEGEGTGLEEGGPVLLRGCIATGDMGHLPASSGAAWHSRRLLCRAGDAGSQPGVRVQTWEVSEGTDCKHDVCGHAGSAHGPRCWTVHGCKALGGVRVQGTARDPLELD